MLRGRQRNFDLNQTATPAVGHLTIMSFTDEQVLYRAQELAHDYPKVARVWLNRSQDVLRFESATDRSIPAFVVRMHRVRTVAGDLSPQGFVDWLRKQFVAASDDTWDLARMSWRTVRPLLRCRVQHVAALQAYVTGAAETAGTACNDSDRVIARRFPGLDADFPWREIPVVDLPDHVVYVPAGVLEHWEVTDDEVYAEAHANVKQLDNHFEPVSSHGRLLVCLDRYYATGRLAILRSVLDPWPECGVIASAPGRSAAMVLPIAGDSKTIADLPGMVYTTWCMWADFRRDNAHDVSPELAYFDGQGWEAIAITTPESGVPVLRPGPKLLSVLQVPDDFGIALIPATAFGE